MEQTVPRDVFHNVTQFSAMGLGITKNVFLTFKTNQEFNAKFLVKKYTVRASVSYLILFVTHPETELFALLALVSSPIKLLNIQEQTQLM